MSFFLFVTANKHEREAFETKFICQEERYILGKTYYFGQFGLYPAAYIHVAEQGSTSPASVLLVGQLINVLSPVAVVMVGIAFGADEKRQKIGDVLVSDKILPYDSQKILENKTEYKEVPKEVGFQLLNAFREYKEWIYYLPNSEQSAVYTGSVLTGSRLVDSYEYRTQLLNDFSNFKPIGGEMEAQGIYSMCKIYGITEWIIVKGICDWGYKKHTPNKDVDQKIAASAAVDYCFNVFSRDGVFESLIETRRSVRRTSGVAVQSSINITTIRGDNYTGSAVNKSMGNNNTFNAPVNINSKYTMKECKKTPEKEEFANKNETIPIGNNLDFGTIDKPIIDGDISKSLVELAKNISDLLENGNHTSVNITFNDIKGNK